MGLEYTLELISNFGALVILAGISVYLVIRVINIFLGKFEHTNKIKNHDKAIETRNKISEQVQDIIHQFLEDCNGDRVHVIEFSNSIMSVAYLPFRYMNCTYEVYRFGKSPIGHRIDRLSTSLFTSFFRQMEDTLWCVYSVDKKQPSMGGAMYDIMKEEGSKNALCCKLISEKGKFIGYVALYKDEEFTDTDILSIQSASKQVSILLSVLDK